MASINKLKTKATDPTDAVFGIDLDNKVFKIALSEGPHWIVAGQSGSGKSVYVHNLLISMMSHALPEELNLMMIDPKQVEFTKYTGLPHVVVDPVTDMGDAYGILAYLVEVMEDRYNKLKNIGVSKISEYNEWVQDIDGNIARMIERNEKDRARDPSVQPISEEFIEEMRNFESMPYLVCVIDEYADMVMQDETNENEDLIVRLAQKARAAGITLLIATQRPSADIISPTIKSNVPARIGLKTTDATNSQIVIDETGLESLNGMGDSIIKKTDGTMTRVQGVYITNPEMDNIFDYLKENYPPAKKIDYKQFVIDRGKAEWVADYDDDVPYTERHIQKPKRKSAFGGFG